MYKSKINKGTTFFNGFKVSWSKATQEELKKVYDLGFTNFVSKENAKSKKTKSEEIQEESSIEATDNE